MKAFNYIPRAPVYHMAEILGTPQQILAPWKNAHQQVKRRFRVRQVVSTAEDSVTGLLEGDPMSCYGMVVCDLYFHLYFQQYMPNIHSFSYVDNLSLLATSLPELVQSTQVFQTWLQSLDLQLDNRKSYAWSTDPRHRKQLQQAHFQVKQGARDLGAQIQFGWQRAVASRDDRLRSVAPLWHKLAQSSLPLTQKMKGIHVAIWPKALHAAQGVFIPEAALNHLRSGAMKGLRFARAGSSPIIRLGLLHFPELDPDFFQWKLVLRELRAMDQKLHGWLEAWKTFLKGFDGSFSPGPFGKLVQLCQTMGWAIDGNFQVTTQRGIVISLNQTAWQEVEMVLTRDWWRVQCQKLEHRKDFAGLGGFDADITNDTRRLTSLADRELLHTCQDGTFYTEQNKHHWDLTRNGTCLQCGATDTLTHRLRMCPAHANLRQKFARLHRLWDELPVCMVEHGLCPQVPWQMEFWKRLQQLPDLTKDFQCSGSSNPQHLFTDGTCMHGDEPYALAAWAVTMEEEVLSAGPVCGLLQSVPRAELTAFLSAAWYANLSAAETHIWTDSQYVMDGFRRLLEGQLDASMENADLWLQVQEVYAQSSHPIHVHKIWSHMPPDWSVDPFTEWWVEGNRRADAAAYAANQARPEDFWTLWRKYKKNHFLFRRNTHDAQDHLLAVAKAHGNLSNEDALESMPLSHFLPSRPTEPNEHYLSAALQSRPPEAFTLGATAQTFGNEVVASVVAWLSFVDGVATDCFDISFLELYFGWLLSTPIRLPIQDPVSKCWIPSSHVLVASFPQSLANRLTLFRQIVKGVAVECGAELCFGSVDLKDLFVFRRIPGVRIGMPHHLMERIHVKVRECFREYPWRRQTDVARVIDFPPDPEVLSLLAMP